MSEISWGWPEIACILVWRLAPDGLTITRRDLGSLPMDRVLLEDRRETEIVFRWISLQEAERRTDKKLELGSRASVSKLDGRWQKIACVVIWKLARDGIVLTLQDRSRLPADKQLLMHGHAQDLELRFLPHAQAAAIAKWERDNEGRIIVERGRA